MLTKRDISHEPMDEMHDLPNFPHRPMVQRELAIVDDIWQTVPDFFEKTTTAKLVEEFGWDKEDGEARYMEAFTAFSLMLNGLLTAGFQAGEIHGFRLACRLISRMLAGKIEEFHNVTPDQLPLLLAGALTDDELAADLIGRIVTGQL